MLPGLGLQQLHDFIRDAAAYYGCDRHSISSSCRRGTVCHGFKWFYEEDFRKIYMNCEIEKLRWTPDPNRDRWTYRFKQGHKAGNGIEKWSKERLQKARATMRNNCLQRKARGGYEESSKKLWKPVICLTDGNEFPSIKHASEYYGISPSAVSAAIHRVGKVHGLKIRLKSQYRTVK